MKAVCLGRPGKKAGDHNQQAKYHCVLELHLDAPLFLANYKLALWGPNADDFMLL